MFFENSSAAILEIITVSINTLLLADVFEDFRSVCLHSYGLDPTYFYTRPGLAWQVTLEMTIVQLEFFTNPDMYIFIEDGGDAYQLLHISTQKPIY